MRRRERKWLYFIVDNKKEGGVVMKRLGILVFSLLLILLMFGVGFSSNSTNDTLSEKENEFWQKWRERRNNWREELNQSLRNMRMMQEGNWMGFYNENIRILSRTVPEMLKNCLNHNNDTKTLNVQYGRYITAFNFCRKQGGGIEECIERVRKTKEEWRNRCKDPHQSLSLFYFKELARIEQVKQKLYSMIPMYGCGGGSGLVGLSQAQVCAFMNQQIAGMFPGSNFNIATGTGTIVLGDGVVHYQGWQFIQHETRRPGGLIVQIFPQKINVISGAYNISAVFNGGKWNVIEFNLPFDSQTEKQFLALGKGVRLTNKEIIDMVDRYLKDTVWEADLLETFQKLLLDGRERSFFMESLLEYYAYDNYLQKVKAEAERQEKALQEKQEEQPKQKEQPKQRNKNKRKVA
jgi:hypothetical protein